MLVSPGGRRAVVVHASGSVGGWPDPDEHRVLPELDPDEPRLRLAGRRTAGLDGQVGDAHRGVLPDADVTRGGYPDRLAEDERDPFVAVAPVEPTQRQH
jgi:hypothetical protein